MRMGSTGTLGSASGIANAIVMLRCCACASIRPTKSAAALSSAVLMRNAGRMEALLEKAGFANHTDSVVCRQKVGTQAAQHLAQDKPKPVT